MTYQDMLNELLRIDGNLNENYSSEYYLKNKVNEAIEILSDLILEHEEAKSFEVTRIHHLRNS